MWWFPPFYAAFDNRLYEIFNKYIEIELQFGNIDRCRKLYEKYLEWSPENCHAWSKFAGLERSLYETERARAVFELAIDQPALDIPELLWKAYIDFEISEVMPSLRPWLWIQMLNRKTSACKMSLNMESGFGELGDVKLVHAKLPKKLTKRRHIDMEDGPVVYEEYIDYLFPEEMQANNRNILASAYKWKKQRVASED
ncbi:hypothetical protein KY284_005998 [Solanum tuberosum]|nr:hypothetical protein KY284_005998 [Solanum tuberosum]